MREIHVSSNGDSWHLLHDPTTGRSFVCHTANESSGSHVEDISLPAFLGPGRDGPGQQALWRMIGSLLDANEPTSPTSVS